MECTFDLSRDSVKDLSCIYVIIVIYAAFVDFIST